jgi:hypothetical protein
LETSLLHPHVRGSAEQLEELLAEDFQEFTASGTVCDKPTCLKALPNEPAPTLQISQFEARMLAPVIALATYRLTSGGESGPAHSLRSSIWRFEDGVWRMVFHQGTPAPGR